MKRIVTFALAGLLFFHRAHGEQLTIRGCDGLNVGLVQRWVDAYKALYPDAVVRLGAEGSAVALVGLELGWNEIAISNRRLSDTEIARTRGRGIAISATEVCREPIALVVHPGNPLRDLSARQVEQVFTGAIRDWSAVGGTPSPIVVYMGSATSGLAAAFRETALKKRDLFSAARHLAGEEQVAPEVAQNPAGIGFVGLAMATGDGVRLLTIDGRVPGASGDAYPFVRVHFFYTDGTPGGEVKRFIDFVRSPAGQRLAQAQAFLPVRL